MRVVTCPRRSSNCKPLCCGLQPMKRLISTLLFVTHTRPFASFTYLPPFLRYSRALLRFYHTLCQAQAVEQKNVQPSTLWVTWPSFNKQLDRDRTLPLRLTLLASYLLQSVLSYYLTICSCIFFLFPSHRLPSDGEASGWQLCTDTTET